MSGGIYHVHGLQNYLLKMCQFSPNGPTQSVQSQFSVDVFLETDNLGLALCHSSWTHWRGQLPDLRTFESSHDTPRGNSSISRDKGQSAGKENTHTCSQKGGEGVGQPGHVARTPYPPLSALFCGDIAANAKSLQLCQWVSHS